ncbi:MAG: hypothetical protein PUC47_07670 [Oscillospiraceae bacterium]|nr:hypothetical protein [Oscillospiraceae bacterium]
MNRLNAAVRRNTLRCLKGRWGKGAAATLFLAGAGLMLVLLEQLCLTSLSLVEEPTLRVPLLGVQISPVQTAVSAGFGCLIFLVLTPLKMGMRKWFYRLSAGPTPDLRMLFDYLSDFRLYAKSVLLQLAVLLRVAVCGALLSLPSLGILTAQRMVGALGTSAAAVGQAILTLLFLVTVLLAAVLTVCFGLRYYLAPYYFAADETISVHAALKQSVQAMRKAKGQVFCLLCSWLPLWLSCFLLVPLIFVIPCCGCSIAISARYLMGRSVQAEQADAVPDETIVFTPES